MAKRIGVISDTHGQLREQALLRLQGCDLIVHAGDVGAPGILEQLQQVAGVVAVRGNVDNGPWAQGLEEVAYAAVEGREICVLHDLDRLDLDPAAAGIDIVVYGHSHQPVAAWKNEVLYLNPGSAGPKRFRLPVTMAFLEIRPGGISVEIVEL